MGCLVCETQAALVGVGMAGVLVFPPFPLEGGTAHVIQRCDECARYADDAAAAMALAGTGRIVINTTHDGWLLFVGP